MTQVDVRGVVRHEADALLPQQRLEVGIRDVCLDEAGRLGQALAAARGEIVDDHDVMAVGEVSLRHVRADESRAPGDQDVHRILSMDRMDA